MGSGAAPLPEGKDSAVVRVAEARQALRRCGSSCWEPVGLVNKYQPECYREVRSCNDASYDHVAARGIAMHCLGLRPAVLCSAAPFRRAQRGVTTLSHIASRCTSLLRMLSRRPHAYVNLDGGLLAGWGARCSAEPSASGVTLVT